eukprot:TRINITY_DN2290_c0_g2_i14.p4 TRINITY_DN2290_c0_g2~~TRINITY_DN2290_c0_g2_i14.p4  ORF type:complete len:116 (+),score=1.53 TRINITY_DN2290_c0_g2_i14:67-414(+)
MCIRDSYNIPSGPMQLTAIPPGVNPQGIPHVAGIPQAVPQTVMAATSSGLAQGPLQLRPELTHYTILGMGAGMPHPNGAVQAGALSFNSIPQNLTAPNAYHYDFLRENAMKNLKS